jgi:hypothetical protein
LFSAVWKVALFVVGPESKHFDDVFLLKDLIDEPVLNVYASRVGASEIANQLFVGRRTVEGVFGKDAE